MRRILNIVCATDLALAQDSASPRLDVPVYFVAKDLRRRWPELDGPDTFMSLAAVPPPRLHLIENIWIVSTYLRLKAKGFDVKISDRLVPDAINVCTSERLLNDASSERAFIVAVQADRGTLGWGEYTLVQSPVHAHRPRTCLIDHWPQPGLISRDAHRGHAITRMGYLGHPGNLASVFHQLAFGTRLRDLGVEWVIRDDPGDWNNFSDLDVSMAVRDGSAAWLRTKPATKLVHSWLTGCPALLGNEPAFRYWGKGGTDYFETDTPDAVFDVIKRLKESPELYRRVQEQGRLKAALHNEQAVLRQWAAVIAGPITTNFHEWYKSRTFKYLRRQSQRVLTPMYKGMFCLRAKGFSGVRASLAARLQGVLRRR